MFTICSQFLSFLNIRFFWCWLCVLPRFFVIFKNRIFLVQHMDRIIIFKNRYFLACGVVLLLVHVKMLRVGLALVFGAWLGVLLWLDFWRVCCVYGVVGVFGRSDSLKRSKGQNLRL